MKPYIYSSSLETARALIMHLVEIIKDEPDKIFNIAFSGGETPALMFDLWAHEYVDITPWGQLRFWQVDERCVPPEHSDSNYRLMRMLLFDAAPVSRENVFRIRGENDPIREADSYSKRVKKHVPLQGNCPLFDIILLGASYDGHTSSIFPGQEQLLASSQIYEVSHNPHDGQQRIALTGQPIVKAHRVIFLITGKNKADIVHEICTSGDTSPAAYLAHHANNVEMFLDAGAGSKLNLCMK